MTVGVILARLQPIHNGHLAMIEKSVAENDKTVILIGSADKFNARNPIPINFRLELTKNATAFLKEKYPNKEIVIAPLDDLNDESHNDHEWGFYLFSKIVTIAKTSQFTIYYSDGYEIITTWFPTFLFRDNISLNLIARNSFVGQAISATMVRKLILDKNDEQLVHVVPQCVFDMRDSIRNFIVMSENLHS